MSDTIRAVIYFFIIGLTLGCAQKESYDEGIGYLKDSTISSKSGIPLDSNQYYLPSKYYHDTVWSNSNIDTFCLKWYSSNYMSFKAPILFNYYLGNDIYRFLWIRSFHRAVLITIENKKKITINTKILKTHPTFWTTIYNPKGDPKKYDETIMTLQDLATAKKEYPLADSIILPCNNVEILLDTTYILSSKEWNDFIDKIDSCEFWNMIPFERKLVIDGAEWILEGQNRNKYHFAVRSSPTGKYKRCCEYLIRLSAAKNEIIY